MQGGPVFYCRWKQGETEGGFMVHVKTECGLFGFGFVCCQINCVTPVRECGLPQDASKLIAMMTSQAEITFFHNPDG